MVYKFEDKSQLEVEEMLGITLKETRVYREIKAEGEQQGRCFLSCGTSKAVWIS